jgi:hypothetical protein
LAAWRVCIRMLLLELFEMTSISARAVR